MTMNTDVSLSDYDPQLALLQRQQKLAEMMQQQGQEPIQPTAYNGIQAPVSPYAALAKALQQYAGGMISHNAFQKQQDLSSQARTQAATDAQSLFQKPYAGDAQQAEPTEIGQVNVTPRVGSPIAKSADEQLAAALQQVNSGNPYTRQLASSVLPGVLQNSFKDDTPLIIPHDASVIDRKGNTLFSSPAEQNFAGAPYPKKAADGTIHMFTKDTKSGSEKDLGPAPPELKDVNGTIVDMRSVAPNTVIPQQGAPPLSAGRFKQEQDLKQTPEAALSPEREAQEIRVAKAKNDIRLTANQYNLTPEETNALNSGIQDGTIDPTKVTSRTAKIFASMKMADPTTDFVSAGGIAALKKNPAVQQKIMAAKTIPTVLNNLEETGKKLNLSDAKVVGGFQNWISGQTNDPNYTAYMTTRNDAILRIAYAMRGAGMSDKSAELENEVAHPTMSPTALHAYVQAQMQALQPMLDQYAGIDLRPGTPGGAKPAAGSPATPAQPAAPRVRVFNPQTGKLE